MFALKYQPCEWPLSIKGYYDIIWINLHITITILLFKMKKNWLQILVQIQILFDSLKVKTVCSAKKLLLNGCGS